MTVVRELAGYKLELVGVQEVRWDKTLMLDCCIIRPMTDSGTANTIVHVEAGV
jgi:hypothetical protein